MSIENKYSPNVKTRLLKSNFENPFPIRIGFENHFPLKIGFDNPFPCKRYVGNGFPRLLPVKDHLTAYQETFISLIATTGKGSPLVCSEHEH